MPESKETRSHFKDSVVLGEKFKPEQAIEVLATFHGAPPENVLKAFTNLRGFTEGTISFVESVNNGNPCISMRGERPDGSFAWSHLIDMYTGQPMVRCG